MAQLQQMKDKWAGFHQDINRLNGCNPAIKKSWLKSRKLGVSPRTAVPEKLSSPAFEKTKADTKRLYVLGGSIISSLVSNSNINGLGAMIFDKNGCLLSLHGDDTFHHDAKNNHFMVSTLWDEEAIGCNAVSLGMETLMPVELRGEENYAEFLIGRDYAYCPIKLEHSELIGGLLLTAPRTAKPVSLLQMALAFARPIELQFFWFVAVIATGNFTDGTGLLTVEQSNNQNRLLICSDEVVRMLGLPQGDYFYEHLENIIEDIPENKRFWDIVRTDEKIFDEEVPLTVGGKQIYVSLSVTFLKEEKFHMHGKNIRMDSIKRINRLISRYAGNAARYSFADFLGNSPPVQQLIKTTKAASTTDSNILLQGESGVGKDIIAQAMHNNSNRKNRPFVVVNCAVFSKELIASELFGYESGAFTGARKDGAIGKFELAQNGTLFLDEIGDMPLDLQAVLLRVLEEKRFTRVGGNRVVEVDVRIIAATNTQLQRRIADGLFREDLFYRLGIVRINIPPLRDRGDDILLLANHFINLICERLNKPTASLTASAKSFIASYQWPGNVRELQNLLEGILNTSDKDTIEVEDILRYLGYTTTDSGIKHIVSSRELPTGNDASDIYDERSILIEALRQNHNIKTKAAQSIDMPISTFYRRLKKHGLF